MKRVFMTAALTGLFVSNNPYAGESYLVYNPHNIAVFEVRFLMLATAPLCRTGRMRLCQPGILASNKKKKYSMLCITG